MSYFNIAWKFNWEFIGFNSTIVLIIMIFKKDWEFP